MLMRAASMEIVICFHNEHLSAIKSLMSGLEPLTNTRAITVTLTSDWENEARKLNVKVNYEAGESSTMFIELALLHAYSHHTFSIVHFDSVRYATVSVFQCARLIHILSRAGIEFNSLSFGVFSFE